MGSSYARNPNITEYHYKNIDFAPSSCSFLGSPQPNLYSHIIGYHYHLEWLELFQEPSDSRIWSWVLRDSEPRNVVLARASSNVAVSQLWSSENRVTEFFWSIGTYAPNYTSQKTTIKTQTLVPVCRTCLVLKRWLKKAQQMLWLGATCGVQCVSLCWVWLVLGKLHLPRGWYHISMDKSTGHMQ